MTAKGHLVPGVECVGTAESVFVGYTALCKCTVPVLSDLLDFHGEVTTQCGSKICIT